MGITYRLANKSDIPVIMTLVNAQYTRKKNEAYFQWQFFNSYYPTVLMCAFEGNKLVGMFGLQKRRLTNGVAIGHLIDLLVAPEWRGRGIFKEMGLRAFTYFPDIQALSVLPNSSGKTACEKAFGMKTIAKIDDLVLRSLVRAESPNFAPSQPFVSPPNYFRFTTNNDYRLWRYDISPVYSYNKIGLSNAASAIIKLFTDPTTGEIWGDIVDYDCRSGDHNELGDLFLLTIDYLFEKGASSINTWALPHTLLHGWLTSVGFEKLSRERYFCVKALQSVHNYLYDVAQWDLVQADAEIY